MGPLTTSAWIWLFGVGSTALWAAIRTRPRSGGPSRASGGRICLVRPCAGSEPGLARALGSTASSIEGFDIAVRFAIASEADAAAPLAHRAAGELAADDVDARVVVTGAEGPNAKADQIARTLAEETQAPDVVLVVDSDVELTPAVIEAVLAPLADPAVAAAWAPPVEIDARTMADRSSAAVLGASMHAFAVLGALDPACLVGKVVALRASALEGIGGFRALRTHLGEDMELARRFKLAGQRVARATVPARSLASGRSFDAAVGRYARWITVIRAQRPHLLATYPLLFACTLPIVLLSGAAAVFEARTALMAAGTAIALRLLVAILARARSGAAIPFWRLPLDALMGDLVLLVAYARALATTRVRWRNTDLRIVRGGELVVDEVPR